MKRIFCILVFFYFDLAISFAQIIIPDYHTKSDSTNRLTVSINVVQLPINELGLYVDYTFNKRHSLGFNVAQIYANPLFKVFYLSSDQGKYPGTVWNGFVARANYKYYFTFERKQYFSAQVMYKSLSYHHQTFYNDQDDNVNEFVRDEKAYMLGFDIITGFHLNSIESEYNFEMFYGLGFRHRVRNYTTLNSYASYYFDPVPIGNFIIQQNYPMIIVGFKVGFNSFVPRKNFKYSGRSLKSSNKNN